MPACTVSQRQNSTASYQLRSRAGSSAASGSGDLPRQWRNSFHRPTVTPRSATATASPSTTSWTTSSRTWNISVSCDPSLARPRGRMAKVRQLVPMRHAPATTGRRWETRVRSTSATAAVNPQRRTASRTPRVFQAIRGGTSPPADGPAAAGPTAASSVPNSPSAARVHSEARGGFVIETVGERGRLDAGARAVHELCSGLHIVFAARHASAGSFTQPQQCDMAPHGGAAFHTGAGLASEFSRACTTAARPDSEPRPDRGQ